MLGKRCFKYSINNVQYSIDLIDKCSLISQTSLRFMHIHHQGVLRDSSPIAATPILHGESRPYLCLFKSLNGDPPENLRKFE